MEPHAALRLIASSNFRQFTKADADLYQGVVNEDSALIADDEEDTIIVADGGVQIISAEGEMLFNGAIFEG